MRVFGVLLLALLTMLLGVGTVVSVVCCVMDQRPVAFFAAFACFAATFACANALDREIDR